MALTETEKLALAGFGINEALLKGRGIGARSIKALGQAAVRLSPFAARGALAGASTVGSAALANPIASGALLGGAALATPQGQDLLAAAEERGRQDRLALEMATQDLLFGVPERTKRRAKRKVNNFSKAVGVGMSAVRASKYQGKKGKLTNAKKTFANVTKVASRITKGKKVSNKGVTGTIARAVRSVLPKKKKAQAPRKSSFTVRGNVR